MMDRDEVLEEVTRCYYNWFSYEREWIRQAKANNAVESLTVQFKKAEEMGKILAFMAVIRESEVAVCQPCIEVAWHRLSAKARRELREECLSKKEDSNPQGALWYSWLTFVE